MRRFLLLLLFLSAFALLLVGVAGYGGGLIWWLDLFANFRLQYILGSAVLLILALLLRNWRVALTSLTALCVSGFALLSVPVAEPAPGAHGPTLTIASFNVLFSNPIKDAAVKFADANSPDIIVFQEFTRAFLPSLEKLRQRYPHQAVFPLKSGGTDVVVISRFPLIDARLIDNPEHWIRVVTAQVQIEGVLLNLVTLHPPTPTSPKLARIRDRNFAIVAEHVKTSTGPIIVIGDFNATLWSRPLQDLFATTDLRAASHWPDMTYPSIYPWPIRIPIDTVLISPGLSFLRLETAASFGSDHLTVVAKIAIGGRR